MKKQIQIFDFYRVINMLKIPIFDQFIIPLPHIPIPSRTSFIHFKKDVQEATHMYYL